MDQETRDKIRDIIGPILQDLGLEEVDLTYRREGPRMVLRLLADRPKGGITVDECSLLNHKIGAQLDEADIIGERFFLEVCSPGLDRPLQTPEDFARNIGSRVKVTIPNPEDPDKKESVVGTIKDVSDDVVEIDTLEGELRSIALVNIVKAKLKVKF